MASTAQTNHIQIQHEKRWLARSDYTRLGNQCRVHAPHIPLRCQRQAWMLTERASGLTKEHKKRRYLEQSFSLCGACIWRWVNQLRTHPQTNLPLTYVKQISKTTMRTKASLNRPHLFRLTCFVGANTERAIEDRLRWEVWSRISIGVKFRPSSTSCCAGAWRPTVASRGGWGCDNRGGSSSWSGPVWIQIPRTAERTQTEQSNDTRDRATILRIPADF